MSSPNTADLLFALIVLTSLVFVLIFFYTIILYIKRHRKTTQQSLPDIEINAQPAPQPMSRQQLQYEHYTRQERIATRTPSIELLPEIRTSNDRADDWLERRESTLLGRDLGVKEVPKTNSILAVESHGAYRWDWRNEKVEGSGPEVKKEDDAKKDSVIVEKP
jgi:cell division protein FtsN